jgi:hypothetical protein
MTDSVDNASWNSYMYGKPEDVTDTQIFDTFDEGVKEVTSYEETLGEAIGVPEWVYESGPDKQYALEQQRLRRERMVNLAFLQWSEIGTKGVIDLASAMEEYVNGK